jgi:hypothetical protein
MIGNSAVAASALAQVKVRGYERKNDTYVQPSEPTAPNSGKADYWSSRPSVTPVTGQHGTRDPYAPTTRPR